MAQNAAKMARGRSAPLCVMEDVDDEAGLELGVLREPAAARGAATPPTEGVAGAPVAKKAKRVTVLRPSEDLDDLEDDDDDDIDDDDVAGRRRRRLRRQRKQRQQKRGRHRAAAAAAAAIAPPPPSVPQACAAIPVVSAAAPPPPRPTTLRQSLLGVLGKLVVWRHGGNMQYRQAGPPPPEYLRGFIAVGKIIHL